MGRLPGGLLHANIASCAVFSAVSGSSVATAATVGTVAIPEMLSRGYEPKDRVRLARGGRHARHPDSAEHRHGAVRRAGRGIDRPPVHGGRAARPADGGHLHGLHRRPAADETILRTAARRPVGQVADQRSGACLSRARPADRGSGQHLFRHRHADRGVRFGCRRRHRSGARLSQLHAQGVHRIADGHRQDDLHGGADHHLRPDPVDRADLLGREPDRQRMGDGPGARQMGSSSWPWSCSTSCWAASSTACR